MSPTSGELITETFDYDGGRQVTVYVPHDPIDAVVFAADGECTPRLGEMLEAAAIGSTMIVGAHGPADGDARLKEYSPVFDADRFAAHEKFFVEDIRDWVQSRFGVVPASERTAVWGASGGGELALAMGVRHPDIYGAVFCASPGGGYRPPEALPTRLPRFYLIGGKQEQWFLDHAIRWGNALRDANVDVVLMEREGEHGGAFWWEEFPLMVSWAFGDANRKEA